jgi:hypothetical protein
MAMAASPSGEGAKPKGEQSGPSGESGMMAKLFQPQPNVTQELANQYFVTLNSAFRLLQPKASKTKSAAKAEQELEKILGASPAEQDWSSANQA